MEALSKKRKRVTIIERDTACQFCNYPFSQRHHALPLATFGENGCTLQLCANCHELYHLVQDVVLHKRPGATRLLHRFVTTFGEDDIRLKKSYHFIAAAIRIVNGNIE